MKNKAFTYFLAFLVLAIWGVILFRIIGSGGNDDQNSFKTANIPKEPYNDYTIPKDTTHLLLNYKDPFSFKKEIDTPKVAIRKTVPVKAVLLPVKAAFNWNFIKYSGYIRNPGSKSLIAVVDINGKPVMMSEGETAERVTLLKNLQDSIKVAFDGKTTCIKISGTL